jgi:hypothetical protein
VAKAVFIVLDDGLADTPDRVVLEEAEGGGEVGGPGACRT